MNALSLAIQKMWPMLKFLKSGSNFKVKVTRYKFFADRQTDRQAKNYMPPIFRYGGIKILSFLKSRPT
jgi:hypothetical protein